MAEDIVTDGNPMWDRKYSRLRQKADTNYVPATSLVPTEAITSTGSVINNLGIFASLATDEDKEHQAKGATPGTYNVIVNPDNFQYLPEYLSGLGIKLLLPLRRGLEEQFTILGDPNIILLRVFKDANIRILNNLQSLSLPNSRQVEKEDEDVIIIPDTDTSFIIKTAKGPPERIIAYMAGDILFKGDPLFQTE